MGTERRSKHLFIAFFMPASLPSHCYFSFTLILSVQPLCQFNEEGSRITLSPSCILFSSIENKIMIYITNGGISESIKYITLHYASVWHMLLEY